MGLSAFRLNDKELEEWYNRQTNKSKTIRLALELFRQKELQKTFDKQEKKIEVIRLG